MEWQEIIALLEQGEGQALEFERQIISEEDLARDLVAFSNSDGGKIIFGIDDKNKHLLGITNADNMLEWINKVGIKHCSPPVCPSVEILDRNGKKIAVITIAEGDEKPYRSDDICYIRDGAESRPARPSEEEELKTPWSGHELNKRQKRAVQHLMEHRIITNREYRDMFSVSHKTAHIELTLLADKGLVDSQGSGRSTRYVIRKKILSEYKTEANSLPLPSLETA
jgi:predicted HTH transcriptional regulator